MLDLRAQDVQFSPEAVSHPDCIVCVMLVYNYHVEDEIDRSGFDRRILERGEMIGVSSPAAASAHKEKRYIRAVFHAQHIL